MTTLNSRPFQDCMNHALCGIVYLSINSLRADVSYYLCLHPAQKRNKRNTTEKFPCRWKQGENKSDPFETIPQSEDKQHLWYVCSPDAIQLANSISTFCLLGDWWISFVNSSSIFFLSLCTQNYGKRTIFQQHVHSPPQKY